MHTINFLIHLVQHHQLLAYGIIFLGVTIEGDFFLISTGILAHLGALNFWIAFPIVLLAGICKTVIGYKLGEFLFRKFKYNKFFKYIEKRIYVALPGFKTKPFWSIFVSKFILGTNNLVIIFSGYEKLDYKKFFKIEAFSTLIWASLLVYLGYFFSYTALHVSRHVWTFLLVVLILYILFILFDKLVSWLYELFEEFYE